MISVSFDPNPKSSTSTLSLAIAPPPKKNDDGKIVSQLSITVTKSLRKPMV